MEIITDVDKVGRFEWENPATRKESRMYRSGAGYALSLTM